MTKVEILQQLCENRERLNIIIDNIALIEDCDVATERAALWNITLNMFELFDSLGFTEVAIYNYLKERSDELYFK